MNLQNKNALQVATTLGMLALGCITLSAITSHADQPVFDMQAMRAEAFAHCQVPYKEPVAIPVPMLDPPSTGKPEDEGLTVYEELAVQPGTFYRNDELYYVAKPRLALNKIPLEIFANTDGTFKKLEWDQVNLDYSSPKIVPPIYKDEIPKAGRVLTEVLIGHKNPSQPTDWPQIFDLKANGYIRFSGFSPEVPGASLRLATNKIWRLSRYPIDQTDFKKGYERGEKEAFPFLKKIYLSPSADGKTKAYALVEGELYCGALQLDMDIKNSATMVVDGYWYMRHDFHWKDQPDTGLIAFSSMYWQDWHGDHPHEAAHDTDTVMVQYRSGRKTIHNVQAPAKEYDLHVTDFSDSNDPIVAWTMANMDHDHDHFSNFDLGLHDGNYNTRVSYKVEVLASNIQTGFRFYEHTPVREWLDNIVGASTIRQDLGKSTSVNDYVHFKYRTKAFYPTPEEMGQR